MTCKSSLKYPSESHKRLYLLPHLAFPKQPVSNINRTNVLFGILCGQIGSISIILTINKRLWTRLKQQIRILVLWEYTFLIWKKNIINSL